MLAMKTKRTLSEQVRRAVDACGLSRYEVCRRAQLDQASMSRFMRGQVGLEMATLDRLGMVLGLELRPTRRASRKGNEHGKAK